MVMVVVVAFLPGTLEEEEDPECDAQFWEGSRSFAWGDVFYVNILESYYCCYSYAAKD